MGYSESADFTPWWTAGYGARTYPVRRVILAVVHSVAAGERVSAAVQAIESEPGFQVVFTQPPGPAEDLVRAYLGTIGALTTPWERVIRERFDLAVTADPAGAAMLNGPLLVLPEVSAEGAIVDHNGRCCVAAIVRLLRQRQAHPEPVLVGLPQLRALAWLRAEGPQLARHSVVVGDPGYDGLIRACRRQPRNRGGRQLGLVLSDRGPGSLFARTPALLRSLATALPARGTRLVCRLHPDVWARHGRRQLEAWAGEVVQERVEFLRPGNEWHVLAAQADFVVGDYGHDTACAAAAGKPVYLALPNEKTPTNSLAKAISEYGKVLNPGLPLASQVRRTTRPSLPVVQQLTSGPGQSAFLLRTQCLRLMRFSGQADR
ncbi:hypothetical protein [Amycolatopsis magusensis]|uniref:CDP-Glycerol:Poly(Glycerophosphate) glycerophosphotransferase n=1 Tax=Amycolatopsis magusensis TaxID=882444 RepID=A0ABS4Q710_9PSEU|nr:hypothetical protein [Amycolatopsis magusensis]MBP2186879.1 hypothetical protein [Amycolatopsis magusensis]